MKVSAKKHLSLKTGWETHDHFLQNAQNSIRRGVTILAAYLSNLSRHLFALPGAQ